MLSAAMKTNVITPPLCNLAHLLKTKASDKSQNQLGRYQAHCISRVRGKDHFPI